MTALIAGSRESPSWINKSRTPHYARCKLKPSRREASDEKTLCRDRPGVQDLRRRGQGLQGESPRDVRVPDQRGKPHRLRVESEGGGAGAHRGVRARRMGLQNPSTPRSWSRGVRPQAQRMDCQGEEEERSGGRGQALRAPQGRLLQGGPPPRGGGDGHFQDCSSALRQMTKTTTRLQNQIR